MNFHLEFPISAFKDKISYEDKILMMGSCFSENIGERMKKFKLDADINPNGILYNPAAINTALKRYINNKILVEKDLFYANETWNSWEHHSKFSNPDKQICLDEINNKIEASHLRLKEGKWLFITFGSAFAYKNNNEKIVVGNCHKIPQKEFTKSLLSVESIVEEYSLLFEQMKIFNPSLNVVFTISPVRYIRDGIVENNLSKSVLIQAVHKLTESFSNVFYFPAYELVMDDLRDYRFYNSDLVHPNGQAIDYVFEKLLDVAFNNENKSLFEKIKDIVAAGEHRPFNESLESHKIFRKNYLKKCIELDKQFPFLNLEEEIKKFS